MNSVVEGVQGRTRFFIRLLEIYKWIDRRTEKVSVQCRREHNYFSLENGPGVKTGNTLYMLIELL